MLAAVVCIAIAVPFAVVFFALGAGYERRWINDLLSRPPYHPRSHVRQVDGPFDWETE